MSLSTRLGSAIGNALGSFKQAFTVSAGVSSVSRPKFLSAWAEERQWQGGVAGPDQVTELAQRRAVVNSWCYSAITMVMRQISASNFRVMKYVDVDNDPIDIPNHPLERLLRQPNPWIGRAFMWQYSTAWLELDGNFYWFLNVDPNDRRHVYEIWPLPSNRMEVVPGDASRFIDKYKYHAKGQDFEIASEYIVHVRLPNPFDLFRGLSPLAALMLSIDSDQAMARWNGMFFGRDNVMPSAIINLSTGDPNVIPDPSDVDRLKADLREEYVASARKTLITTANTIAVEQLGWNMRELDFIQGRSFTQKEIFTGFGVPMGLIDPNATEASAQTADRLFKEGTIWPTLVLIAEQLTSELVAPFYGDDLEAAFSDIRPTDRAAALQEVGAGQNYLLIDEIRHRYWGLSPLPDGRGQRTAGEPSESQDVSSLIPLITQDTIRHNPNNLLPGSASTASTPSLPGRLYPQESTPSQPLLPAPATNEVPKAITPAYWDDLRKWRNKAVSNFKAGKSVRFDFDIPSLPDDLALEVVSGLSTAKSVDDVYNAFEVEPWKRSPRAWSQFEELLHRVLSGVLRDESARIASEIEQSGAGAVDDPTTWLEHRQKLAQSVEPIIQDVAQRGVELAKRRVANVPGQEVNWNLVNQQVADWARSYAYDLVGGLTDTTRQELTDAVSKWTASGEPLQKLVDWVQGIQALDETTGQYVGAFSPARARMIATTEATRVFAEGNNQAWSSSGVHPAVFVPPGHVQCILPGNEVVAPGRIAAAAKSFYIGRCVEIILANGRKLSVTENHPILTVRGWIPAQFLREGDDVISTSFGERIARAIDPDNDHRPMMIEQVFDSLVKDKSMLSVRVPVSSEDFHGDGGSVHGNIEVVYVNCFLDRDVQRSVSQKFSKDDFSFGGPFDTPIVGVGEVNSLGERDFSSKSSLMGRRDSRFSLFGSHVFPSRIHGFGDSPWFDSQPDQSQAKGTSVDSQLLRQRHLSFARQVSIDEGLWNVEPVTTRPVLVDLSPFEKSDNGLDIDPALASKFCNKFTSQITTNQIISIRQFDFSGHVYDLQVDGFELYICNGVVVKNCRCYLQPYQAPDGSWVTVWYTVRDDHVCVIPFSTPWGMRKGCKAMHLVVVSDGPYGGMRIDEFGGSKALVPYESFDDDGHNGHHERKIDLISEYQSLKDSIDLTKREIEEDRKRIVLELRSVLDEVAHRMKAQNESDRMAWMNSLVVKSLGDTTEARSLVRDLMVAMGNMKAPAPVAPVVNVYNQVEPTPIQNDVDVDVNVQPTPIEMTNQVNVQPTPVEVINHNQVSVEPTPIQISNVVEVPKQKPRVRHVVRNADQLITDVVDEPLDEE